MQRDRHALEKPIEGSRSKLPVRDDVLELACFGIQPVFSVYCCVVDSVSILYRRLLLDIDRCHVVPSLNFIISVYQVVMFTCIYVCMYVRILSASFLSECGGV